MSISACAKPGLLPTARPFKMCSCIPTLALKYAHAHAYCATRWQSFLVEDPAAALALVSRAARDHAVAAAVGAVEHQCSGGLFPTLLAPAQDAREMHVLVVVPSCRVYEVCT